MIDLARRFIIPAAYDLLPAPMASPAATAMLLAIGLQESKFLHRRQLKGGPARGFWQFERGGGVVGVLRHPATAVPVRAALGRLRYASIANSPSDCHELLADNDVVAAVFARLLLWTVPGRLPTRSQQAAGWRQYIDGWRPGKPHPETWAENFRRAWELVDAESEAA